MKKNLPVLIILLGVISGLLPCRAQHYRKPDNKNPLELTMGIATIYTPAERKLCPGLHLHLSKSLNHWLGIGLGYEYEMENQGHHCLGINAALNPLQWLSFEIGPILEFPYSETTRFETGLHTELCINMGKQRFHFGPLLELGMNKNSLHLGAGLHLGVNLFLSRKAEDRSELN